jgi:hypothetical protein
MEATIELPQPLLLVRAEAPMARPATSYAALVHNIATTTNPQPRVED